MSLLMISMLFISEYKKVTNYKLASQTKSGSFKAMCAIHYGCKEQPNWSKDELGKVCSSSGAERCSEGTAGALLIIHPVQTKRRNLRQDGVWNFLTSWRNCGSDIHGYGDWILDTDLWIGQAAHRTPWTVAMRQIPVKGSTDSIFALAQESSILQSRNMKNWMGKKSSFEAQRRELQKNWSIFKNLKSPKAFN